MKAVVLREYGPAANLKYEDFPNPTPGAGEVLVRVSAAGLNPVDWMVRAGTVKDIIPITFPYVPGYDLAGVVREVGAGVSGFAPGDPVMALASRTFAELCVVKAGDLVRIPDGLGMTDAAALPLVTLTGDQLVRLGANVQPGQTVLVTGALGGVGRSAVFAAAEIGARVIAGVRGRRLDEARRLPGVAEAVAVDDPAALDALAPLDCVADTLGGEVAERLLGRVRPGGTFGCFPSTLQDAARHPAVHINSVFARADAATTRRYAEAVRDGRLTIPVARILPLAEAAQAQAAAEQGGLAKIVLTA